MKRALSALVALALVALGAGSFAQMAEKAQTTEKQMAAEPEEQTVTLEGEMVDMKCYLAMDMPGGGKHHECAVKCAKMGIPAGVMDAKSNKLFTVLAPAGGLADLMGKTVRITGTQSAKSTAIIPEKIEVKEGDKWKEFKLPEGMM